MVFIKYGFLYSIFSLFTCVLYAVETELVSYQSFDHHGDHAYLLTLPSEANFKQQQFLEVELGCAVQGCSDWDYTVRFEWLKDGHRYEFGRLITPYAGYMQRGMHGFNRSWRRKYVFEISHLAPVLKGEGTLNVHYGGWGVKKSAFGFSAKLITRGTVARRVNKVVPMYYSASAGWPYKSANEFSSFLPAKEVTFSADDIKAQLKVIVSAHGHALSFDNPAQEAELCGEWCERYFELLQNERVLARTPLWRTDCDQSATFPQGGTYIYARANWCPGEVVEPFSYELDTRRAQSMLDIDWQTYTWQPSQYGSDAPRYIVSAVLVTYGPVRLNTDLAIEQILAPNNDIDSRTNTRCGEVSIAVVNQGQTDITDIDFWYGVTKLQHYLWHGELNPGERQIVTLPARYWGEFTSSNARLTVQAITAQDENSRNDFAVSNFDLPQTFSNRAKLYLTTGKFADETSVSIKDRDHHLVKQWHQFNASSEHILELDLPVGCYNLEVNDTAQDGLAFPFLNQRKGQGSITIHDPSLVDGVVEVEALQADFGRKLSVPFTVGYRLGECAAPQWQPNRAYSAIAEKVGFQGIIYKVKHWSYNFQPDKAGPYDAWLAYSYCDGSELTD
ncbi:peptide-N-glycosidase F-related protein [Pseudoalteromonas sp. MMG005]|uniref:peptide-N-glycosidase F-related protein n=1 Tax=Pseudoalteromonas sp. MMG005 TaxID=2822682 RepID=UPI001B3A17CC|nr:peptide-N-glycosidase F-related protein [Pseudoalteromonas sp. MMG005]MBQ4846446.1 hypothetical protein [Pseudoalteromonas sp. MMG005]